MFREFGLPVRNAIVLNDLPDVDVGQAGGWSGQEALRSAYQQPDDSTTLKVVTYGTEMREPG